jgi:predicted transposase/invertase (TIGR01784 family)
MLLTMWEKRGQKVGREEGREEGKIEVAKKLLERGMALEDIRNITGLSAAKIDANKRNKK